MNCFLDLVQITPQMQWDTREKDGYIDERVSKTVPMNIKRHILLTLRIHKCNMPSFGGWGSRD